MQTTIVTLLGCLLAWTLSTTAFARPAGPNSSPPSGNEQLRLEKRVPQLEQMVQELQERVALLEAIVYSPDPICSCLEDDNLSIQDCQTPVGQHPCVIRPPTSSSPRR